MLAVLYPEHCVSEVSKKKHLVSGIRNQNRHWHNLSNVINRLPMNTVCSVLIVPSESNITNLARFTTKFSSILDATVYLVTCLTSRRSA